MRVCRKEDAFIAFISPEVNVPLLGKRKRVNGIRIRGSKKLKKRQNIRFVPFEEVELLYTI